MKEIKYATQGTCSKLIYVQTDDENRITQCQFVGGCHGNLQGIPALIKGQKAEDVIARLKGISCNGRPTSCPDQLAKALEQLIAE